MEKIESRYIWLNGESCAVKEAKINVLSPTAQFGANVFEGIRCYWNEEEEQLYAFRLKDHYKRLAESLKLFRIALPCSWEEAEACFIDIIKKNNYREDIAVRQTVFVDGPGSWFSTEPTGMFIAPIPKGRKETPLQCGEKTCISSWERISDRDMSPRAKIGANYINSRLAKLEAEDNGYDSALFLDQLGHVSEGTGSCFFMVKDGRLITPSLTDSILQSITRDTLLKLARDICRLPVEERVINRTEVYLCEEAFFCGSAVEIAPVRQIDSYRIGQGRPGEITNWLHDLYLKAVTGKLENYKDWLTPVY